jgi:hypothetical protein
MDWGACVDEAVPLHGGLDSARRDQKVLIEASPVLAP